RRGEDRQLTIDDSDRRRDEDVVNDERREMTSRRRESAAEAGSRRGGHSAPLQSRFVEPRVDRRSLFAVRQRTRRARGEACANQETDREVHGQSGAAPNATRSESTGRGGGCQEGKGNAEKSEWRMRVEKGEPRRANREERTEKSERRRANGETRNRRTVGGVGNGE